jgi:hypothetical protein
MWAVASIWGGINVGGGDLRTRDSINVFARDAVTSKLLAAEISTSTAASRLSGSDLAPGHVPARSQEFGFVVSDPFDPREVGWVVVVGAADPAKAAFIRSLSPLAERRGGVTTWGPLEYPAGADVSQWIEDQVNTRDPVPGFVLLAGSPSYLPFALHSALSCISYVGRLDFSTVSGGMETQHPELVDQYVAKVIGNELDETEPVRRDAVFWAPSHGGDDPTVYSRWLLAAPLAARLRDRGEYRVAEQFGRQATVPGLLTALSGTRPALVFTASHGTAAEMGLGVDQQAAVNGLPIGQDDEPLRPGDLPDSSSPFVEGGLIFQFGCFGYGTPQTNGYTHWWSGIDAYKAPFEIVSALPKAAVAHPRGPLGYIGHADYAVLHSFTDASDPGSAAADALAPRMAGFRTSLDKALGAWPLGAVLEGMGRKLGLLNQQLTDAWDKAQAAGAAPGADADLVDTFIRRNDARYYFLLGDPAARPRIEDPDESPGGGLGAPPAGSPDAAARTRWES